MIRYAMIGFGGIAEHRLAREGFALDRTRFAPLAEAELVGATDVNPARRAAAPVEKSRQDIAAEADEGGDGVAGQTEYDTAAGSLPDTHRLAGPLGDPVQHARCAQSGEDRRNQIAPPLGYAAGQHDHIVLLHDIPEPAD